MKILIAAGGSGGHIFPAIALAEDLESRTDCDILFCASNRRLDKNILQKTRYRKVFFSINPMPYKAGIRIIPFLIKCVFDVFLSLFVLFRERPRVVIGFGGYTAGTIVMLASFMRIRTIIHEQNLVPGRANKLLDKIAGAVAVSFDDSRKYFNNANVKVTGNPLRKTVLTGERKKSMAELELDADKFTILIMGGSQGAKSLNILVSEAIIKIEKNILEGIQVLHIAGPVHSATISDLYHENGVNSKTFGFMDNIKDAYNVCDLCISRSGAACIFELAYFAKPMILIPYPFKKNNQRFNAAYFSEQQAAICVEEKKTGSEELKGIIKHLLTNRGELDRLSERARLLSMPEAAEKLGDLVITGT